MELIVFISLLALCVLLTTIFLICRLKYGYLKGLYTKAIASFGFVVLAVFLFFTKVQISYFSRIAICCIILGLVCGLIGDILLDLKVIYPFHNDSHLRAGMVSFGLGHLFYIVALLVLVSGELNIFENWLMLLILFGGSIVLSLLIWLASAKILKFNYGTNTLITNCYSVVLIFTTALSVYLCFVKTSFKMYIMAIGFGLFLISDLILSMQYFGKKQENKTLTLLNHLFYYLAQIVIASFIYFI